MSASADEIRIRRGKHELVASGDLLTVGDKSFALSRVDRVIYRAATRINQAQYVIGVAQGDMKHQFLFEAFKRGTEFEDARDLFYRMVDLLERQVCPRIADEAVRTISTGGSVAFGGPPAARIDTDREGLRKRQLFAKKVPWSGAIRSDFAAGQVRVWTSDGVGDAKPTLSIDMGGWNAVILPRVVAVLGRATRPKSL